MPINNPSSCSNCNIQNSNPSINNNSTLSGTNNPDRITIQKRYNPGLLLNTNLNTNEAVSEVQNVSQQSRLDLGYLSQRRKMTQTANQNTLNILKNLLDIDTEIVRVDKSGQKTRKLARQSSAKNEVDITPKAAVQQQQMKTIGEKKGRVQHTPSDEKKEKKKKTSDESRLRNRSFKSVGTDLASSSSFKAKFSILLQQNIATEQPSFEFDIPAIFDGRKVWGNYISDVRAQGICGSCWAFSSVFVLETRLSIYSKGKYNYNLSPAKMIFCGITKEGKNENFLENLKEDLNNGIFFDFKKNEDKKNENISYGCSGENLINAWQFLYRHGVPENDCFHYGDEENVGDETVDLTNTDDLYYSCSELSSLTYDVCPATKKRMISHRAGGFYLVPGTKSDDITKPQGSEYNIRKEIYKWGPCTSGMMVYQDFIDWNGIGIYEYDGFSEKVGGHAIVLMGWGEEQNGKKYWIVRNSWGPDWGDGGYFKILRGSNHCEIEENIIVGFPNIPAIRLFLDYPLLYEKEDLVIQSLWQIRDNGIKETTLEQLSLGNIKDMDILENNGMYSIKNFPNFYNFIAGKIIKENFCCENKNKNNNNNNKLKILLIIFLLIFFYFM